jgi:hypothetical protein
LLYLSNSQQVWRVTPSIGKKPTGHGYINKGHSETDTQLPIKLNCALVDLANKIPPTQKLTVDSSHSLVHTLRERDGADRLRNTYLTTVKPEQFVEGVKFQSHTSLEDGGKILHPETIKLVDEGLKPDFKDEVKSFHLDSPVYGSVTARIFHSVDNRAQYLFYETSDGKAFIAAIELVKNSKGKNIPINKYGVREESSVVEGLLSPLREYYKQVNNGYTPQIEKDFDPTGQYISNWNYVRKIPLVEAYYEDREIPQPPSN